MAGEAAAGFFLGLGLATGFFSPVFVVLAFLAGEPLPVDGGGIREEAEATGVVVEPLGVDEGVATGVLGGVTNEEVVGVLAGVTAAEVGVEGGVRLELGCWS